MYLSRKFNALALVFTAALGLAISASAQQTLGGITGTVLDPQGAAIPGVAIDAVSAQTKL